jgi:hypothetical protein
MMPGRSVFHLLGFGFVAALAVVAVIWWVRIGGPATSSQVAVSAWRKPRVE